VKVFVDSEGRSETEPVTVNIKARTIEINPTVGTLNVIVVMTLCVNGYRKRNK
jgi:hypothetical protein